MTMKRFTHRKWYDERQLLDDGEPFAIVDTYVQSEIICDKLNKLNDENNSLKKDNAHLKVLYHNLQDTYSGLLKIVHGCKE